MEGHLETKVFSTSSGPRFGEQLNNLDRCPHCSIANPHFSVAWASQGPIPRKDGGIPQNWGCFVCSSCGSVLTVSGKVHGTSVDWTGMFPQSKSAHKDLPEAARKYLQQAFETLHAPDAAAVMAGSAVDAMLKARGLSEGSLYSRIDKALEQNLLTKGMADWAHAVRLGSNRPRHADADKPHVSPTEAKQSVEFAEALGNFLFVLTAQIERGLANAGAKGRQPPAQSI
ncbi:DUF4145 domain-containing protein [Rhodopseudomonas sp. P1]|uniref:DUF4145 domain-containing protein n=1 Tax=Rhodopseudomonas sp. P1 TaxID=3434357 RepID=UPI003D2FAD00